MIVFDADTGAFKRMWGAFGNAAARTPPAAAAGRRRTPAARCRPAPALDTEGPGSQQFGGPVHGVKVSNDGLVYVADRPNRRVQVFTPDGKYVTQVFINRAGPSAESAAGLAFSPDTQQQFLYVADYGNSHIAVLDRKTLRFSISSGSAARSRAISRACTHLAVDSKGNLYTGEVARARARRGSCSRACRRRCRPTRCTTPAAVRVRSAPGQARGGYPPWTSTMASPYRMTRDWPQLGDIKPGAAIGIIPDGKGGTWLHHRSEPPILHIDADGDIVKSFGDGMFVQAHGFCQDRDGNFWAGDSGPFRTTRRRRAAASRCSSSAPTARCC